MKKLFKNGFLVLFALLMLFAMASCDLLGSSTDNEGTKGTGSSEHENENTIADETSNDGEETSVGDSDDEYTVPPIGSEDDENPPAEVHERSLVYIELRSDTDLFCDTLGDDGMGEMRLSEFIQMYLDVDYETTATEGSWYADYREADADTVIRGGVHLIYLENGSTMVMPVIDPKDDCTYVNYMLGSSYPLTQYTIQAKYRDLTLKDFVEKILPEEELFSSSYDRSLRNGYWCINGEEATGNTLIADGDTVSYHTDKQAGSNENETPNVNVTATPDDGYSKDPGANSDPDPVDSDNGDRPGIDDDGDGIIDNEGDYDRPGEDDDFDGIVDNEGSSSKPNATETTSPKVDSSTPTDPEEIVTVEFVMMRGDTVLCKLEITDIPADTFLSVFVDEYLPQHINFGMSFRESIRANGKWSLNGIMDANAKTVLTTGDLVIFSEYVEGEDSDDSGNEPVLSSDIDMEETAEPVDPVEPENPTVESEKPSVEPEKPTSPEEPSSDPKESETATGPDAVNPDDAEHEHEWNDLFECTICGTLCTHDSMTGSDCPDCGFTTGGGELVVNMMFNVYGDGQFIRDQSYTTIRGNYVTVRQLFCEIIGLDSDSEEDQETLWESFVSYYEIVINDMSVDGDFEMSTDQEYWEIYLNTRQDVDQPEVFEMFSVEGMWYIASEDGSFGSKYLRYYVDRELTVTELLTEMYVDVSDFSTLNCYLNNQLVEDINSYVLSYDDTVSGTCYLVLVPKTLRFSFTFTVVDKTGDTETSQVYSFTHPIYWSPLEEIVLADRNSEAVDFRVVDGDSGMIYEETYYADKTVEIVWHEETVTIDLVTEDGSLTHKEIVVTGAKPTLEKFASLYLDIDDFDAYYFFDPNADFASSQNGEITHYYELLVMPKSIVPEAIEIEYEVQLKGEETIHTGTLVLNAPEKLHTVFANEDVLGFRFPDVFEAEGYNFYIDGELVKNERGKPTYYILLYKTVKLVVEPVYPVYTTIEGFEERLLKLESADITFAEIAEILGVEFNHYVWNFNGYTILDASEAIGNYTLEMSSFGLNLRPKYVVVEIDVYDAFGKYRDQMCSEDILYSVTADEIFAWIAECGYDAADYHFFYFDPMYEERMEFLPTTVFTCPDGVTDNVCYRIVMEEIGYPISVYCYQGGNQISSCDYAVGKDGVSVVILLGELGYSVEDIQLITYKDADGNLSKVDLNSTIYGGALEIEYFMYHTLLIDFSDPDMADPMLDLQNLSLTLLDIALEYGLDFDRYRWIFNGYVITDAKVPLSDYADASSTWHNLYVEKRQMEISLEVYSSEFSYETPCYLWNSEKEPLDRITPEALMDVCGVDFSDYTWYLYDAYGEILMEIENAETELEFDLDSDGYYTYYRIVLVPESFSVSVELYVNDMLSDDTMSYTFDSHVTVASVVRKMGYSWEQVQGGFVERNYCEGTDAYSDTVLDGPCKLHLYIYITEE
ncbi:MAG: hypothetical protein IJX80_09315 [Clostridia bacterium]|nr:hypothetical protein [Clostridia bacterium]